MPILLLKRDAHEAPADGGYLLQFQRMAYLMGYDVSQGRLTRDACELQQEIGPLQTGTLCFAR